MPRPLATCAALALAVLAGGCRFIGATTHNLDELHASDGRHLRSGRIVNHWEYAAQVGINGLMHSVGTDLAEATPKKIEDPVEECIKQLRELQRFDSDTFSVASTKVEYFGRIAVLDSWHLSRELAVTELGKAGKRLDLARHPTPPPETPATPEQVREALQKMIDAANTAIRTPSEAAREEFARASTALAELPLDLEGALRALRSTDILLRATNDRDKRVEALRPAATVLQRKVVTQALARALKDEPPAGTTGTDPGWPNPKVQAAAIAASVAVWGPDKLRELILALPRPFNDSDPTRLAELFRQVARVGLPPPPPDLAPAEARQAQYAWTYAIVLHATQNPTGSVRLAAMSALGKISGKGRFSLREEDWQEWWSAQAKPGTEESQGP